jgi:branched-chain amino acid transport system ATP-binding protein
VSLWIKDLSVIYDRATLLREVSLHVDKDELVSLLGANGAGKTTLLRAIAGLVGWERDTLKGTTRGKITIEGSVIFNGEEMTNLPAHEIAKRGLILCPERGRLFHEMTVMENFKAGALLCKDKNVVRENLKKVYQLFPVLEKRENQISGTLSGGERIMLSVGRALLSQTKLLLIDEPSTGLAPLVKRDLFGRIKDIHRLGGITIFMVEQDISFALDMSMRNYILSQGRVVAEGTGPQLLSDEIIKKTYLGL